MWLKWVCIKLSRRFFVLAGYRRRPAERPTFGLDPEPRLEDFHRPYEGEEFVSISDDASLQNLLSQLEKKQIKTTSRITSSDIYF
jgi:hypothetical protein